MFSSLKRAQDAAGKLKVRSALNPFLWLCGIGSSLLLATAYVFDHSSTLQRFCLPLVYVALGIPVATVGVGIFFAIRKPEKLQSEDYQIRSQALLLIQQMGGSPHIIDPTTLAAIANPAVTRALAEGQPK